MESDPIVESVVLFLRWLGVCVYGEGEGAVFLESSGW